MVIAVSLFKSTGGGEKAAMLIDVVFTVIGKK